jgi:Transglutaminase-like superfamily
VSDRFLRGRRRKDPRRAGVLGVVSVPLGTTHPEEHLSAAAKLRLAGEILATYVRVRWLLHRRELPQVVHELRESARRAAPEGIEMPDWNRFRLADAVVRLLRVLPTDSRCLMRSLVLLAMLERRRVCPTLVIGVRTEPEFAAHAWVERDGKQVLADGDGDYTPLTVL